MSNVFVITGAPGGGKTSILNGLMEKGFKCFPEESRILIKELTEANSKSLPWIDLLSFNELLLERQVKQYLSASEDICFLDRSFVDNIGYLNNSNIPPFPRLIETVKKYRFNKKVFFTEPWEEIYANDAERKEPFSLALTITRHMKNAYVDSGYEIVPVPKLPVPERVNFILKELDV